MDDKSKPTHEHTSVHKIVHSVPQSMVLGTEVVHFFIGLAHCRAPNRLVAKTLRSAVRKWFAPAQCQSRSSGVRHHDRPRDPIARRRRLHWDLFWRNPGHMAGSSRTVRSSADYLRLVGLLAGERRLPEEMRPDTSVIIKAVLLAESPQHPYSVGLIVDDERGTHIFMGRTRSSGGSFPP